jgi:NADPH:quinone reductase-like Zn-dependent oxidoreductase
VTQPKSHLGAPGAVLAFISDRPEQQDSTVARTIGEMSKMKAIVFEQYGSPDRIRLRDVPVPEPANDEVLVRVRAASVNPVDWHRLRGEPFFMRFSEGLRRPQNTGLGADLAGTVAAVGAEVSAFRPGDEVFGMTIKALAEYAAVSAEGLVPKPGNLSFEQAAAVPLAGLTAAQALRGRVEPGQRVLVNGASGGVGTFAVQIAKALGAEVTALCSAKNVELVRSLGADDVVDYTREDFTRREATYDLVVDAVMNRSLGALRRAAKPDGTIVLIGAAKGATGGGPMLRFVGALLARRFASQTVAVVQTQRSRDDLLFLAELIEAGKVTPVIDRTYPLSETAEAIRYLETLRARGKVVIRV